MCDHCKCDKGKPDCPVCKGEKQVCSRCGGNMLNVQSIKLGLCLWCRPWFEKSTSEK